MSDNIFANRSPKIPALFDPIRAQRTLAALGEGPEGYEPPAPARAVLEAMRGRAGHIFNLGHGLTPGAKLENITALVETVKNFK